MHRHCTRPYRARSGRLVRSCTGVLRVAWLAGLFLVGGSREIAGATLGLAVLVLATIALAGVGDLEL